MSAEMSATIPTASKSVLIVENTGVEPETSCMPCKIRPIPLTLLNWNNNRSDNVAKLLLVVLAFIILYWRQSDEDVSSAREGSAKRKILIQYL